MCAWHLTPLTHIADASQRAGAYDLVLPCRILEQKLAEAKSKKDTLKARAKSAAASRQINDMIQGLNTSNALTAFEKMEEKVMALEAESEATLQVLMFVGTHNSLSTRRLQHLYHQLKDTGYCRDTYTINRVTTEVSRSQAVCPTMSNLHHLCLPQLAAPDNMEQKFQALEGGDVEDELSKMKRGMLSGPRSEAQLPEGRPYEKVLQPRDAIDEELEVLRRKARD